jgi:hypothetical protein
LIYKGFGLSQAGRNGEKLMDPVIASGAFPSFGWVKRCGQRYPQMEYPVKTFSGRFFSIPDKWYLNLQFLQIEWNTQLLRV